MALKAEEINQLVLAPVGEFKQIAPRRFALKTVEFIDTQFESFELQAKQVDLPLCSVFFVNCLGLLSCYIFDAPSFHVTIDKYYIRIRRQEVFDKILYKGANFIYQDKFINVIHSDEGASLISPSKLCRVIKPDMVRKSDKKGD